MILRARQTLVRRQPNWPCRTLGDRPCPRSRRALPAPSKCVGRLVDGPGWTGALLDAHYSSGKMVLGTPAHCPAKCLECLDVLPAGGEWKILDRHPTRSISGVLPVAQNPSAPGRSRTPLSCFLRPSSANPRASYPGRVQWHLRDWLALPHESHLEKRNLGSPSILQSRSRQPRPAPLLSEFESCQDRPSKVIIRNRFGDSQSRGSDLGYALVTVWEP